MTFCNTSLSVVKPTRLLSDAQNGAKFSNFSTFAKNTIVPQQLQQIKGGDDIIIDPDPFGA